MALGRRKDLPPLTPSHVWRTMRRVGNKAPGLDGIGFDLLKNLPHEAMLKKGALSHCNGRAI